MDVLNLYKSEVELIRSVIDLAASRRVPINSHGDYDEWLSFDCISEALDDLCKQLHISRQVEQHCYQTLLRMSAESENHLTWWEKIAIIHKYLPHANHVQKSKHSPSNRSTHHQQASMSSHSLPTPMPHLIRLVEPERTLQMRPSMVPSTSPSTLLEANNLSMLLNDTYAFQTNTRSSLGASSHVNSSAFGTVRNTDYSYNNQAGRGSSSLNAATTPVRSYTAQNPSFSGQGWMSTHGAPHSARRIHFQDDDYTAHSGRKPDSSATFLQEVIEKVSSIEKETQHTKDIIASLYGIDGSTPQPVGQANRNDASRGDWTLSPSIIHDQASVVPDTPFASKNKSSSAAPQASTTQAKQQAPLQVAANGATADSSGNETPAETKASNPSPSKRATKSKAFSDLLRHSGAMSKYLGIGRAAGESSSSHHVSAKEATASPVRDTDSIPSRSPRAAKPVNRARSASPPRSQAATPLTGRGANAPVGTPRPAHADRKAPLFDSPDPPPRPPQHHHHFSLDEDSPGLGDVQGHSHSRSHSHAQSQQPATPSRSYSAAAFMAATPSRVVPLVLQGHHGAGGVYTPEGHINTDALDFDPRLLHGPYALDAEQLSSDQGLVHTVSSATRVLVLFHRWLLQRSEHTNIHFADSRNAALMLVAHFATGSDFVSSLFGLEQWLRDKMKLIASTEAKAYIFRVWNLHYGVSAKSRMYWRTRRLHLGFESFLEYGMKRRMHRRNALHALAARRRHADPTYMSPVLRHRPARASADDSLYLDDRGAEEGEEGEHSASFAQMTSRLSNLSDLSGLNKYSNLDMTMFQASQRQQQKRAQYLTSLSIREIMNDAKSALLMYGRSGGADGLKVKTREYQQAQDAVALLFAFRRLYHRSIYITRMRKVRARLRSAGLKSVFGMWKDMWASRLKVEVALEPHVQSVIEQMKVVKKGIALRRFQAFVHYSKKERHHLVSYNLRIRAKPVFLRAFHMIRCAAYVKCFFALKNHFISHSPTAVHFRQAENQQVSHSLRLGFRYWRRWYAARNSARRDGFQAPASRRILMAVLLQRSAIWHIVQQGSRSGTSASAITSSSTAAMSTDTFLGLPAVRHMHFTAPLVQRTVELTQLRRALIKLRKIGNSTRVYFSLTELRFAQALCRRSMPSERRKYMGLVNDSSCRILPSMRGVLGARLLTEEHTGAPGFEHHSTRHHQLHHLQQHQHQHHGAKSHSARRTSEEKPYRLVAIHPHTLRLFMRTIYNSTPLEHHEDSEFVDLAGDSLTKSARLLTPLLRKPLVTLNGTVLANTPQLLRMMRKWRVLCGKNAYLRKLGDKVRKARELVVLREKYQHWIEAFQNERQCNRCNKRRAWQKYLKYMRKNRVIYLADKKTKRGLVLRHWLRLAAAHTHHTELRRLHAGHFYNSVVGNSSQKVVHFIVNHHSVPFSVRHFLSHYPSYRFPIYRQYDATFWEHSHQTSAHQAILVISQHHKVYNHENHLTHHLELFHHHHQSEFRTAPSAAAPSHHSGQRSRPMHLTPGVLLGPQPFSVSAAIASLKYSDRSRSVSPQKARVRPAAAKELRAPAVVTEGGVPAAAELASAAVFMSHWISECLEQYYALRRGLYLLRRHAARSVHRKRLVRTVHHGLQADALRVLWQHRRKCLLTKRIHFMRLKRYSERVRAVSVCLKFQRRLLKKHLQCLYQVYRYRITLRIWQSLWLKKARLAWDQLVAHTRLRQTQQDRVAAVLKTNVLTDTMRVMCAVVTASAWRRRRARVAGLRAFVYHYNDRVLQMDRANAVRLYAQVKHFAALKESMFGLLKQRLSSTVAMNYCKKRGLIRGFLALYSAIQQPQRLIHESVLKDRMYDSIEGFRRYHSTYCEHTFRNDVDLTSDNPAVRTGMAAHRRRLFEHKQHMFDLRASVSPYVSAVLPLPSPVPPAQTISTTVRRASMLREKLGLTAERISLDTLTEAAPMAPVQPPSAPSIIVSDRRSSAATPNVAKSKPPVHTATPTSAAQLLFGSVGATPGAAAYHKAGASADRRSVLSVSVSNDFSVTSGPTSSTLAAMAERRRSTQSMSANTDRAYSESPYGGRASGQHGRSSSVPGSSANSPFGPARHSSVTGISNKAPFGDAQGSLRQSTHSGGSSFQRSAGSWSANISNASRSFTDDTVTRRSSLHEAHAQAAGTAASNSAAFTELGSNPLSISLSNTGELPPMAPQSILITSPAYTGASRATSRADSRIFFSDHSPAGTPAASVHSGRRHSMASQPASLSHSYSQPQASAFSPVVNRASSGASLGRKTGPDGQSQQASSSLPPRRASMANVANVTTGTTSAPLSPLTQNEDTPHTQDSFFFLDENSTEASTMRESAGPSRASLRVQRRRNYVHDQRNEETAEQLVQLDRAQKKAFLRKWLLLHRYKNEMRQFCANHSLRRTLATNWLTLVRQLQISRFQRQQENRCASHRVLVRLSNRAFKAEEGRQIVEFSEKYYVVMALKLNLRKWRARTLKSLLSNSRQQRADHFSRQRTFARFLVRLRAKVMRLGHVREEAASPPPAQTNRYGYNHSGHFALQHGAHHGAHRSGGAHHKSGAKDRHAASLREGYREDKPEPAAGRSSHHRHGDLKTSANKVHVHHELAEGEEAPTARHKASLTTKSINALLR